MTKTIKARKPMSRRSRNRGAVEAADAKWREAVRKKHGGMVFGVQSGQDNRVVCHHWFCRRNFPHLRHDPDNGVAVTRYLHDWLHASPKRADEWFVGMFGWQALESLKEKAHKGGKGKVQQ